MFTLAVPLVLASRSPRRRRLLEQIGLGFEVRPSDIEEHLPPGLGPGAAVEHLALQKAESVAPTAPEALTLGADTVVVLDDEVLGKPAGPDEAAAMLGRLSGRTHTVFTGVALVHPATGRRVTAHEATAVTFAALGGDEIAGYVATGSPMDKAGGYGIQDDLGALLVERIAGDYYNVVGLPLRRLYEVVREDFADLMG